MAVAHDGAPLPAGAVVAVPVPDEETPEPVARRQVTPAYANPGPPLVRDEETEEERAVEAAAQALRAQVGYSEFGDRAEADAADRRILRPVVRAALAAVREAEGETRGD